MSRATTEEWSRYYEGARQRRRKTGGDPIERYLERRDAREKRFFVGSTLLLVGVLVASYSLLVH